LNPGPTEDPVYYRTFNPCTIGSGRCLVVEYDNYHHYPGRDPVAGTFEAVLFDNGNILVQFQDAGDERGSSSTTGIESHDGTDGVSFSCNDNILRANTAICFSVPGSDGC
jgi:hypothetical protein